MKKQLFLFSCIMVCTGSSSYAANALINFAAQRRFNAASADDLEKLGKSSLEILQQFNQANLETAPPIWPTLLGTQLDEMKARNAARTAAYNNRLKTTTASGGIDTFKAFKLISEQWESPRLKSYLQLYVRMGRLLGLSTPSAPTTFDTIRDSIASYKDGDSQSALTSLEKEKAIVQTNYEALTNYFQEISIPLSLSTVSDVTVKITTFAQAIDNITRSPVYQGLSATMPDDTLLGKYLPLQSSLDNERAKYAGIFKLKATDNDGILKQLDRAVADVRTQLTSAMNILRTNFPNSSVLYDQLVDIAETFKASGATIILARLWAESITVQCKNACAVLGRILVNCRGRMTFSNLQEQQKVDAIVPLLSPPSTQLLSTPSVGKILRTIAVNKQETSLQTYSDDYAFTKTVGITNIVNGESTIVSKTLEKFENDTQLNDPKNSAAPSPQAVIASSIQEIPEIAQTNEIGFLANQLGLYYQLVTALTTQDIFDYRDMLLRKFPQAVADKWAPATTQTASIASDEDDNTNTDSDSSEDTTDNFSDDTNDAGIQPQAPAPTTSTALAAAKRGVYQCKNSTTSYYLRITDSDSNQVTDVKEIGQDITTPWPTTILTDATTTPGSGKTVNFKVKTTSSGDNYYYSTIQVTDPKLCLLQLSGTPTQSADTITYETVYSSAS